MAIAATLPQVSLENPSKGLDAPKLIISTSRSTQREPNQPSLTVQPMNGSLAIADMGELTLGWLIVPIFLGGIVPGYLVVVIIEPTFRFLEERNVGCKTVAKSISW